MAFYNRGVAYANLGDHQKAINDYNQAIAPFWCSPKLA
jgi:Flp pilus assembly protein TadD